MMLCRGYTGILESYFRLVNCTCSNLEIGDCFLNCGRGDCLKLFTSFLTLGELCNHLQPPFDLLRETRLTGCGGFSFALLD